MTQGPHIISVAESINQDRYRNLDDPAPQHRTAPRRVRIAVGRLLILLGERIVGHSRTARARV